MEDKIKAIIEELEFEKAIYGDRVVSLDFAYDSALTMLYDLVGQKKVENSNVDYQEYTEDLYYGLNTMDIYSPKGTKVVFAFPDHGYQSDKDKAEKHLKLGEIYTVKYTDVHSSCTDVYLEEFPDVWQYNFNSVMFAMAKDVQERLDKLK